MANNIYGAITLSTGVGGLKSIDGDELNEQDSAIVMTGDTTYCYTLDATSGASEDSPNVISPNLNPGTKRWILLNQNDVVQFESGNYTVSATDDFVVCDSTADITFTLYDASLKRNIRIGKAESLGTLTVVPSSGDTIEGLSSIDLTSAYETVQMISDGVQTFYQF